MKTPDYGQALRALPASSPTEVGDRVASVAYDAGATDVVCYLVDFEQLLLTPLPTTRAHLEQPAVEQVEAVSWSRALTEGVLVAEERAGRTRVWVPLLEGDDRTGVLALTVDGMVDVQTERCCRELGILAGLQIVAAARTTDFYNLIRRRKAMSLAASMQWDLLPPLRLRSPRATSVGLLEPAYEVGGDCFDHAVSDAALDVAIMDAMGHGVRSSIMASLAMGIYRHDRREGQSLAVMHRRLDEGIAAGFDSESFVTGQLMHLELASGEMTWVNAGHPPPLLLRRGRVVRTLESTPSLPWGLGGSLVEVASTRLEPGDGVLFYTDGVIEGRSPVDRAEFGIDRFVSLVEDFDLYQAPTVDVLRRLTAVVRDFQGDDLFDDATVLLVTWDGDANG
jgi:serine phosphatase RsbU (regulator of sigma subunit)